MFFILVSISQKKHYYKIIIILKNIIEKSKNSIIY